MNEKVRRHKSRFVISKHCLSNLVPRDELLWSLSAIENLGDDQIDEYLKTIRSECKIY